MVCNRKRRSRGPPPAWQARYWPGPRPSLAQNSPPATLWFQDPVTEVAHRQIDLHNYILLVCVRHLRRRVRRDVLFDLQASQVRRPPGRAVPREHAGRGHLDGHPVPDPAVHGVPGDAHDPAATRTRPAPSSPIKVTGYQWKWGYDYLQDGVGFYSNLATPLAQIDNREPKGAELPARGRQSAGRARRHEGARAGHRRRRAARVVGAGVRRQAGCDSRLRARHVVPRRAGGRLSRPVRELCGKEHGFMPIVVEVKSKPDYAAWVAAQKQKASRRGRRSEQGVDDGGAHGARPGKCISRTARPVTRPTGQGVPPAFPRAGRLEGRARSEGRADRTWCLNGKPGTAMAVVQAAVRHRARRRRDLHAQQLGATRPARRSPPRSRPRAASRWPRRQLPSNPGAPR